MHELLAPLNPQQQKAAAATDGPVLILAGAGSGKTKTLIHRIAYIIASGKARPYNILAVTFTNKAAKEMKNRLQRLLAGKVEHWPIMGTFHSVCVQILRREIIALEYDSKFVIYDDADSINLVKKSMKDLRIDTKAVSPTGIRYLISKVKNELYEPAQYEASDTLERTAAQVYTQYQAELKRNNALDFDDLIRLTVKIFRDFPEVLQKYQTAFKYILVDEYQDTNHAQYILVNLLAKVHNNICVVGDDFQCVTPNTKIKTPTGWKLAKSIRAGDTILAGAGRGALLPTKVKRIYSKTVKQDIIELKTKLGYKLQITPQHILFARLSDTTKLFYVYLMYHHQLGYRVGLAKGQRMSKGKAQIGLQIRGNQERADKMWVLKVCESKASAQYWEMYFAFYYGIPTIIFNGANLTSLTTSDITALFKGIDTASRAQKLCQDLGISLDFPHYRPSGTTRFQTERKVLRLDWFADNRLTKASPWYATRIALHTTNARLKALLKKQGYSVRKSKKDTWRLEISQLNIHKAEIIATQLHKLLPTVELVRSAWLTEQKKMLLLPAAQLHQSMLVPVLHNGRVVEDEIISVRKTNYHGPVIDLDIAAVHNYCANGIMVHNSIYSWRGANLQNILDFEEEYPKATVVLLEQNYRSTKTILNAANEIIKYNVKQKAKTLWTENDTGHKIVVKAVADEKAEGDFIIREIFSETDTSSVPDADIQYIDEEIDQLNEAAAETATESLLDRIMQSRTFQGYQADQRLLERIKREVRQKDLTRYVILYRTNAQSRALEEMFIKYRVPYKIIGGFKFYERKEIKDFIAYLRVLANPNDWVSLERIINVPARGIGQNSWHKIEGACRDHNVTMLEVTAEQLPVLRPQSREAFVRFQKLLQELVTKSAKLTPSEIVELVLRRTGYKEQFNTKLPEDMSRLENIEELKSVTKGYDNKIGSEGLHAFLEEITLVSDQDDVDDSNNAVNLMTIHAAKGLEFDTVFICGMEDGLFPHSRSLFQPSEMEEERRLCYVALTRAKRRAYFIYAEQRTVYGSTQITAPSRFLNDLPKELVKRS